MIQNAGSVGASPSRGNKPALSAPPHFAFAVKSRRICGLLYGSSLGFAANLLNMAFRFPRLKIVYFASKRFGSSDSIVRGEGMFRLFNEHEIGHST